MQKKSRTIMKEVYDYAKNITPGDYGGISETKFCRDYGENPAPWRVGPFQILPDMTFAKERPFEDPTGIGWESHFIFNPSLIVKDDQLYLFYRAAPQKESLSSRIGLAVYQEGKGWEDLSGPPILYPTEDGETHGVEDPKVYFWNGRYYMFYQSVWQPEGEERQRILGDTPENWEVSCVTRLAVSNDLLHWEKKGLVLPYEISRGWCKGAVIPRDGNGCPVKIHGKFLMFVSEGCAGRQQDLCHHGSGRRLPVGAGDRYGILIIPHDLSQQLGSRQDRNAPAHRFRQLRIILMHRRCIHHNIHILREIGGPLSSVDYGPVILKMLRQSIFRRVRAADPKSSGQQDLGQAAHADSADPNKMYCRRFSKIYLIHR